MAKDTRDWGIYESHLEWDREIRKDLAEQRQDRRETEESQKYRGFLNQVGNIGRGDAIKFKYTEQKVRALIAKLGIVELNGFGSLENILDSIQRGTCDDRTRVAVHNAYQGYIKKAEEYLRGYRERKT